MLDIKFVGRTSQGHTEGRSHRILILCTNDLIVLHSLGICFFVFFSEKNPVCRDRTHVPTCQKVTRLPLSYRGDHDDL